MGKCYFLCTISSKRLDAELIRRGHDIRHKRYPIGYQEAPLAYDAVWSVALAFNRTMERLARKDKKRSLKDFTYTDAEIAGEIYASMNSTSFLGVSVSSNQQEQTVSTLLILFRAHGKEAKLLLKYFPPPIHLSLLLFIRFEIHKYLLWHTLESVYATFAISPAHLHVHKTQFSYIFPFLSFWCVGSSLLQGVVAFSSQGDRIAITQIEQMIDGKYAILGHYDIQADNLSWTGMEKWHGNKVIKLKQTRWTEWKKEYAHTLFIKSMQWDPHSMWITCIV